MIEDYIDGLAEDSDNSIADTLELPQTCVKSTLYI